MEHHVLITTLSRGFSGGGDVTSSFLLVGEANDVSTRVAETLVNTLEGGRTTEITFRPVHPARVERVTT